MLLGIKEGAEKLARERAEDSGTRSLKLVIDTVAVQRAESGLIPGLRNALEQVAFGGIRTWTRCPRGLGFNAF